MSDIKEPIDANGNVLEVGDIVYHRDWPETFQVITEIKPYRDQKPDAPLCVMCGSGGSNSTSWHKVDAVDLLHAKDERINVLTKERDHYRRRIKDAISKLRGG